MISVKRLSNKEAKLMITAAEQMSDQIGLPMCIAVTDESGNLIGLRKLLETAPQGHGGASAYVAVSSNSVKDV